MRIRQGHSTCLGTVLELRLEVNAIRIGRSEKRDVKTGCDLTVHEAPCESGKGTDDNDDDDKYNMH